MTSTVRTRHPCWSDASPPLASAQEAATDYLIEGGPVRGEGKELTIDFGILSLPDSFVQGLQWLGEQPQYALYPLFWQKLMWGWGGILPDERRGQVLETSHPRLASIRQMSTTR